MKVIMVAGEYLVGIVILFLTLLCFIPAAFFSLLEFPRYSRNMGK